MTQIAAGSGKAAKSFMTPKDADAGAVWQSNRADSVAPAAALPTVAAPGPSRILGDVRFAATWLTNRRCYEETVERRNAFPSADFVLDDDER